MRFKNFKYFKRLKEFQSFQLISLGFSFRETSVIARLQPREKVEITERLDDIDPQIEQFGVADWSRNQRTYVSA
jgi:hypothetical protein